MLRLPLALVSAIAGMMVVVGSAYALPEGSPEIGGKPKPMPETGLLHTVRLVPVQRELNLSAEQKQKISALIEQGVGGNGPHTASRGIDVAPIGPEKANGTGPSRSASRRQQQQLALILKPEQMKRLKQLDLQIQGMNALRNPEVIGVLGLTAEQQEKLNSLFLKHKEKLDSLVKLADEQRDGPVPGEKSASHKRGQVDQELKEKALQVLTPEQRQKFEDMNGEPQAGRQTTRGG